MQIITPLKQHHHHFLNHYVLCLSSTIFSYNKITSLLMKTDGNKFPGEMQCEDDLRARVSVSSSSFLVFSVTVLFAALFVPAVAASLD